MPSNKPTPKQQAALDYLRDHPDAPMSEVCLAVGVANGFGNWGDFFYRMSESGYIKIVSRDAVPERIT